MSAKSYKRSQEKVGRAELKKARHRQQQLREMATLQFQDYGPVMHTPSGGKFHLQR